MATLIWLRVVSAVLIGFVAWDGALWAIPLSILVPCLVAIQPTRLVATGTSFAYYAAASTPVIAVAKSYWPCLGWRAVLLWIAAAAVLSVPSALCWSRMKSRRPWTTAVAVALSAVPPLCIVGWASPLVSAGVLFPNAAWLGVIATLALPTLLLSESTRGTALFTAVVASVILNFQAKPLQTPRGWEAETTRIHRQRTPDDLADFGIEERLQRVAVTSRRAFVVFPEAAVRRWTDASDAFWTEAIAGSGKTLLIGAVLPIAGSRLYNNSVVIVGEHRRPPVYQRVPVPGGMWNPFRREGGFALNLLGAGMVEVGRERAAVLICYEQLLVWPMLRSAVENPTLLIAVSNEAWTASTRVPSIQHACVRAWARLFGLPMLSAINS